jgi:hypothetical protein
MCTHELPCATRHVHGHMTLGNFSVIVLSCSMEAHKESDCCNLLCIVENTNGDTHVFSKLNTVTLLQKFGRIVHKGPHRNYIYGQWPSKVIHTLSRSNSFCASSADSPTQIWARGRIPLTHGAELPPHHVHQNAYD